jgi:mRNA-degrading endonuclease RelE of RelBE toxin-antitoxin system
MKKVEFSRNRVKKQLENIEPTIRKNIIKKTESVLSTFSPQTRNIKWLKKYGCYRLRIGEFRVGFIVNRDVVNVRAVGNRKNFYDLL